MQVQVQTLARKDELTQKDVDDLDLFVGLRSPLNSPYNIFLRLKDLENDSDIIYFYAYSMGTQKVILWGIYEKSSDEFLIDNSCQYNPNDLKYILDTWRNNEYNFFFTAMRNRIVNRVTQYTIYGDDKNEISKLVNTFKKEYLRKLQEAGSLNRKTLSLGIEGIDYDNILNYVYSAGLKVAQKIATNKSDKFTPTLNLLLNEIDTMEDEEAIKNIILTNIWNGTEFQIHVAKHILVHLFLVSFLTIDDYRVAKYINYIHNRPEDNEKLMRYLKGSFLYEWLLELGNSMRIYNLDRFMKIVSDDILRLTEEDMNMTNVGVIGGPKISGPMGLLMEKLSDIFENFISKSKYSKISYVNKLAPCPSIKFCQGHDENCDLYSHGYTTQSIHDIA